MPSTYSTRLRIELPADNELTGFWGQVTNRNTGTLIESAIAGYRTIALPDSNYTLAISNGLDDEARYAVLNFTGTLTATRNVVVPSVSKVYVVRNQTNQTIVLKTASGTGRSIPTGKTVYVYVDGIDIFDSVNDLGALSLSGNLSYSGTLTGGTGVINIGAGQFYKDGAGNIGIGNATPSYKVDITGPANGLRYKSGDTVGRFVIDTTGVGGGGQYEFSQNGTTVGGVGCAGSITGVASDNAALASGRLGSHIDFYTNGTASLVARLFATGQFSVGLPTTNGKLSVETNSGAERALYLRNSVGSGVIQINSNTHATTIKSLSGGGVTIGSNGTTGDNEIIKLTPLRYIHASNTGVYGGVAGFGDLDTNPSHLFQNDANNTVVASISSSTGSSVTGFDSYLATGATGAYFQGSLNQVVQFRVAANGNVTNTNNSYGAISDATLKTKVLPAPSMLEKHMQIEFKTYEFKPDLGLPAGEYFGVIAQKLQEVFPQYVDEGSDGLLSVNYAGLSTVQGKVIQEQQALIADLMARVAKLEAK
jgi:hypothetical protein